MSGSAVLNDFSPSSFGKLWLSSALTSHCTGGCRMAVFSFILQSSEVFFCTKELPLLCFCSVPVWARDFLSSVLQPVAFILLSDAQIRTDVASGSPFKPAPFNEGSIRLTMLPCFLVQAVSHPSCTFPAPHLGLSHVSRKLVFI